MRRRRTSEAEQRVARRWQQADDAPRLLAEIPELESLRMVIEESSNGSFTTVSRYTRLFVLTSAPALFWMPCGNPRCEEGGHDLTYPLMSALRARKGNVQGVDECGGMVGSSVCGAVIRYDVTATYKG
jgi:hypothetical protein